MASINLRQNIGLRAKIFLQPVAAAQLSKGKIGWSDVKRKVQKSCMMLLEIFSLYSEMTMQNPAGADTTCLSPKIEGL